jgi:mono/diheme cytochrome c family protein
MALSVRMIAYGGVAAAGVILVMLGTPRDHTPEAPTPEATSAAIAPPSLSASGNGVTLRSVNVEFPDSDRGFPGGDAADIINGNCMACHSAGMILNQPILTTAQWQAEVNHMRMDFKAPVAQDDVAAIVAYLAATKGPK